MFYPSYSYWSSRAIYPESDYMTSKSKTHEEEVPAHSDHKTLKQELRQKAGEALLCWLDRSSSEEFMPEDYDDSEVRNLKVAYAQGYNDCRAEAMRKVAALLLDEEEEDDEDEDEDCDCCDD